MKTLWLLALAGGVLWTSTVSWSAEPLREALEKGLLEEEANQNLNGAIQAYQAVLDRFAEERRIAATAAFRLGECYRKEGKTNEAFAAFQRVVREFGDQPQLAQLSRRYLAEAGRTEAAVAAPMSGVGAATVTAEQAPLVQQEIDLVKQQLDSARRAMEHGKDTFDHVVQLQRDLLQLQRKLPDNTSPDRQRSLIGEEIDLVKQLLAEQRKKIEVGAAGPIDEIPLRRDLLRLEREQLAVGPVQSGTPPSGFQTRLNQIVKRASEGEAAPDEESKEISRLQEVIKNSPDLVNARGGGNGTTPLQDAAAKGQLRVAQFLLEHGAEVNSGTTRDELTALYEASLNGHKAMVELLLAHGADVKARTQSGETALFPAAERGYRAVAQVLLEKGAKVDAKDNLGDTPLFAAVRGSSRSVAELLLQNKADINVQDRDGWTPLMLATALKKAEMVPFLLEHGADPNIEGKQGTALTVSLERGTEAITRELLEHEAHPNVRAKLPVDSGVPTPKTPLIYAVMKANTPLTELLLAKGADVNAQDDNGRTALEWAVTPGNVPLVRLLLEKGADPNVADQSGETPFTVAIPPGNRPEGARRARPQTNNTELTIVELLLSHGANVNLMGNSMTPLARAVEYGDTNLITTLIAHKADVNEPTRYGSTPLTLASKANDREVTNILLDHGAKPNQSRPDGLTALHFAANQVETNVAALLLEHGADPNAKDNQGNTPLHYATFRQSLPMVELLVSHGANPNAQDGMGITPMDAAGGRVLLGPSVADEPPKFSGLRSAETARRTSVLSYLEAHGGQEKPGVMKPY